MDTNTPIKAELLDNLAVNMNADALRIADVERARVMRETGNRVLAQEAWIQKLSDGYLVCANILSYFVKADGK